MIKATARGKDGRQLVLLGLSDANVARAREGKPVHVLAEEIGLANFDLYIIVGKDEATMQESLGGLIHPTKTEIRDHRMKPKH